MKKVLLPGMLAVFLFVPRLSQAVPLSIPYQILISTVNSGSVTISTSTFPSGNSLVNSNVANYQWCVDRVLISSYTTGTIFTMAWSTSTLSPATTDFIYVINGSAGQDLGWSEGVPYCAPVGRTILKLTSSLSSAIITVEAYLFKGWTP